MQSKSDFASFPHGLRWLVAVALTGVAAGFIGFAPATLPHAIQHVASDYSVDTIFKRERFLHCASTMPAARRVAALTVCGAAAGFGW